MVFKEVLTVIHCTHWTLAPPAPLPPSRPTPRSKRGTSLSLGHYSIMLGWVDGGKVQSGGESRAAREAFFFAGGLRSRPFKRPSSSLYASLSCLSASPAPLSLAISARSFVRPQPWPSPSSTPLFLPPAPPARELASICIWHRTQWTPRWPRWSTDRRRHRLWTGRRRMTAETAEEVNGGGGGGREERERASGRKKRGALLPGTHAEIARESLLGHESPGRIVYKVVPPPPPPPQRPRERATIVRANVKGAARVEDEPKGGAGHGLCDHRDAEKGWNGARGRAEKTTMLRSRAQVVVPLVCPESGIDLMEIAADVILPHNLETPRLTQPDIRRQSTIP